MICRAKRHTSNTPHSNHGKAEGERPLVVCIDDDLDITTTIEVVLNQYELDLCCNYSGEQGLSDIVHRKPDLILTDWLMPDGDGEDLVKTVKRNRLIADIPIVVISCLGGERMRHRLSTMGVAGFIQKPLRAEDLLDEIRKHIELEG